MVGKEARLSPSPTESGPDSDLNSRAENWLERAELEEEPPSEIYIEGLGLLAELAGVDPNILPLKRGASGEIIIVSKKLEKRFSQGYGGYKGKTWKHAESIASGLGRVDPLIAHPKLIDETFFRRGKRLSSYERRLELLRGVGLTEKSKEYSLILALQIKIAAQRAMLKPIISKAEVWRSPRLSVILDNPKKFFIKLLSEPEYYRGFDRRLEEAINQYTQKVFGKDAEEALSLWQGLIIPRSSMVKEWLQIDRIQQQGLKLLAERNWEEAREFLVRLIVFTPERFYFKEAEKYVGKRGKTRRGKPLEVLGVEKITDWAGRELPEPKNYIRLGYFGKGPNGLISPETFIKRVNSGEFAFSE